MTQRSDSTNFHWFADKLMPRRWRGTDRKSVLDIGHESRFASKNQGWIPAHRECSMTRDKLASIIRILPDQPLPEPVGRYERGVSFSLTGKIPRFAARQASGGTAT